MPDPTTAPSSAPALFVAVGHQGQRLVSENGTDWKNLQTGKEGEFYRAVAYGNGRYVAVGTYGGENVFAATSDGEHWETSKRDGKYKDYVRGLGFGNGTFLAIGGDPGSVGSSSPFVTTSTDGVKWSDFTPIKGKNIIRRIAYGNGVFAGVGDRGRRAASKDGKDWTDAPDVKAIDTLVDIAFGGLEKKRLFVGVGLNGLRMCSEDGVYWNSRQVGEEGEHLNSIVWAGDRFVAVGMGATFTSPDGYSWTRKENKDAPLTIAWGKDIFVGANWRGRLLRSTDAVEWKQVYKSEFNFEALAFGGT